VSTAILMSLPDEDFDVTEVSVPWRVLTRAGHRVVFATESGASPAADPRLLTGVLFGQLGAAAQAVEFYRQLEHDESFLHPVSWDIVDPSAFAGMWLAGGHAQGMRQYLESEELRRKILAFWRLRRPLAAICHGVLVLARTVDPATGSSVLYDRNTTCLPKYMERTAYVLTAWKLGRYYRTYPAYVEDEVRAALASPRQFMRGPISLVRRGSARDDRPAFVVADGPYLSARWPGDAYLLAKRFDTLLERQREMGREAG
jgi:putative intracellular protease/amidase